MMFSRGESPAPAAPPLPEHWLAQLARACAQGPDHVRLYSALLEHARAARIDRLVQLLDMIESDSGLGHARTRAQGRAVDHRGAPTPWFTYPALAYLDQLDLSGFRVLEAGAGGSTFYWASRCREVVSVEHDPAWTRFAPGPTPPNCTVTIAPTDELYARAFAAAPGRFDLIVIDGRARLACARSCRGRLSPGGFIILDNAEWYPNCAAQLRELGLIQIDFTGLGPVADFAWTTSLFISPDFRPVPRALPFPRVGPGCQAIEAPDDLPGPCPGGAAC